MGNVRAIAGREFRSYFDQATAYILLVVFLAINFFFYFRTVFVTGEASLRPMFELLPWLLLFFAPAVSMRSLAEERSRGTEELVLAQPIRESEYLLGKFLGIMGFLSVAMGGTLGAAVALRMGGEPFLGVIVAQYVGALLFASALVAIGLWASSLTRNQITAFITAVATTFVLMALTMEIVLIGLPPFLAAAATRLGLLTHFSNITRGVLDLRDLVYFASVTVAFLALAYLSIQRGRLSPRGRTYRTLQLGTLGLLAICVVLNLLGRDIRGRLDLTPGKAYTLSETTRSTLEGLEDVVTVSFFASRELPPQAEIVRRDVEDILADYEAVAGDNLQLRRYAPSGEDEDRSEAERLGIPSIQFNVLGQEEFQVKQGYLGIAIQYAEATEIIPFVGRSDDLEYRLTSSIMGMTSPTSTAVGFLTGHGEPDIVGELSGLGEILRETYSVLAVNIAADTAAIADSVGVLVVPGPQTPLAPEEGRKLAQFLDRGGNLFLLVQAVSIDDTRLFSNPAPHPVLDSLVAPYGVRVADGMVFDIRSNGRVTMPGAGGMALLVPYPLWPRALPASPHTIVEGLSSVLTAWTSPLDLSQADSATVIPLLSTTEFGGHLTGAFPISPQFDWNSVASDMRPMPIAAAVLPPDGAGSEDGGGSRGRLVVVGDADFVTNRFLQANPENVLFAQNAVDWLAQDESLIAIRSKARQAPSLLYSSEGSRDLAKYGNLIGIPLLFVLIGAVRLVRRRRLQSLPYVPLSAGGAAPVAPRDDETGKETAG
jgi:ABC-2 type transport system permease protein